MAETNYDWIEFYTAFADKLLEYKNNRGALISNIQKVYESLYLKMPRLDTSWISKGISLPTLKEIEIPGLRFVYNE